MASLADVLTQIAQAANLNAAELMAYADEDTVGGRDRLDAWWPAMSVHEAEGKVIYALVRAIRPVLCVEIGTASGGTSTHILTALERNGDGHLISYDIESLAGFKIPDHLRGRFSQVIGDAMTAELPGRADFVFEDSVHTYDFTRAILTRLKTLNPRVLLSHDYYSHEVYGGFGVKQAFDEVMPGGFGVKIDGAFTGLGVWVNPDWQSSSEPDSQQWMSKAEPFIPPDWPRPEQPLVQSITDEELDNIDIVQDTPKPKRGRKPRAARHG